MSQVPTEEMNAVSLDNINEAAAVDPPAVPPSNDEPQFNEDGSPIVPPVTINGKSYKALADGKYDVIVLSTGLSECVLAGLLSVRGLKVLQIDRNDYYGGQCASYNLKELYESHNKTFNQAQAEQRLGRMRDYCVDTTPKLLMANGKLVKMLIQTGVTRYIDFNGISGSYVFNTGKIYRLPVHPNEVLSSPLVSTFQKLKLRSFAQLLGSYKIPKRLANTVTKEEFANRVTKYYQVHQPAKIASVNDLVNKFDLTREKLVVALETKYGLPVFEETVEISFGEGSLGFRIDSKPLKVQKVEGHVPVISSVVCVTEFLPKNDGGKGPAESSRRVAIGDIIHSINGQSVLGKLHQEVSQIVVGSARPMKITFMKPAFDHNSPQKYDLSKMTMRELYKEYGLDETTQNFIGHAMALQTDDTYLDKPAESTILACQLYGRSVGLYKQDSPYLYPNYGLSTLPEGFSRVSAIYGGTVMLRTDVDEIIKDDQGKVAGVRCGEEAASAKIVIGDFSYFPQEMKKPTGKVARSVCILRAPIPKTKGDSSQIILPAKHLQGKKNDVYISMIGPSLHVCPKGFVLAIASTKVETNDPMNELKQAFALMGKIEERFDSVTDTYGPVDDGTSSNCYIVNSLDATSHFETAALDIMRIYQSINKKGLNIEEKLVADQE